MASTINIDALESVRGETDGLRLQCAIVDAINIYCRDVLDARGAIAAPVPSTQADEEKYAIALRVALSVLGRVPDLDWRAPPPPELVR